MGEEAEDAEAVVGLDHDHAFFGKSFAVVTLFGVSAGDESTAVIPDVYREFGLGFGGDGNPDCEVETVFAWLSVAHELKDVAENIGLHTGGTELIGAAH